MNPAAVRKRLRGKIAARWGDVSAASLRELARVAGVSATTLGRFLRPTSYTRYRTGCPRESTLQAVSVALDLNYAWVRDGQGSEQLGVWPVMVREMAQELTVEPLGEVRRVLDQLNDRDPRLVQAACRGAVAGLIDAIAQRGDMVPPEAYAALIRLDSQRRRESSERRAAG